jgi:WD40 repeat protein
VADRPGGETGRSRLPDRPDVFVSYSRRDRAFVVDWLVPALLARDKDVWIDAEDIPPAADWRDTVLDGIAKASAFVFVLSPDSLASPVCAQELERAGALSKRLIPVLRRDVEAEVPEELQRPNWILLRDGDDRDRGLAKLTEALETDLEWREMHTRIGVRAEEWVRGSRDGSFLLRGSDLSSAEDWLARQGDHEESATPEQAEYIVRSREAANRRQRATFGAVLVGLMVAIGLAIFALIQRNQAIEQARIATSRELAATSLGLVGRDPELAVLLAREASAEKPTQQAEDALRRSLLRWPERFAMATGAPVSGAEYSPDGRFVVTAGGDAAHVFDAVTGRLVRRLPGPGGDVSSARFSPDGRTVLIAGVDGVTLADARSGRVSARLTGQGPPTRDARFARGGRVALAVDVDSARLFDTRAGRVIATLDDREPIAGAAITPAGDYAVTHGASGSARVWRVSTGRPVADLPEREAVVGLTVSPDGRLVAVSSLGSTTTVWSIPSGRRVARLRHLLPVSGASFSQDGRLLATASSSGKVWDTRTHRTISEPTQDVRVTSAAFSPDGARVVTGDANGDARVFDVESGRLLNLLSGHTGEVSAASFNPDGRLVLTGGRDGTARIWESVPGSSTLELRRGGESVEEAVASADGRTVATASDRGVARLWNSATGELRATLRGPGGALTSVAWSRDGRLLAAGGRDGAARTWAMPAGRPIATLRGHDGPVVDVAVSADARYVATIGDDLTLRIWDGRTGRAISRAGPVAQNFVTSVDFALGGRRIVLAADALVALGESESAREVRTFPGEFGGGVSPDGSTLATGAPGRVTLRRASDGEAVARLAAKDGAFSTEFGPGGESLAAVDSAGIAYAWDLRSRERLLRLRRPAVFALTIGPQAMFAAAGHIDGFIRVYELGSGDRVATLGAGEGGEIRTVTFLDEGRSILTRDDAGGAWVHRCDVCLFQDDLMRLARRRVTRSLTAAERRLYLHE